MTRSDDTGKLILRLALGLMLLLHGIAKLSTGVGGIASMLASHGLPGGLAYAVFIGEIVAPLLLVIGFCTRPAAWVVVINMLVAIWLAHGHALFSLGKTGGWTLELQGLFLFGAMAIALLGAGRFSVGSKFN